jgi:DNA-binding MarR family transcriptional regulator
MTILDSMDASPSWSFLTLHARILLCLAEDPDIRLRDLGDAVGVTERAAQRVITELVEAGYVSRIRKGRRNHYTIRSDLSLPDPLARGQKVGDLLGLLSGRGTLVR